MKVGFQVDLEGWVRVEEVEVSITLGFLGSLDGKESSCNVGDLGLIYGLRRSPGGIHGNSL